MAPSPLMRSAIKTRTFAVNSAVSVFTMLTIGRNYSICLSNLLIWSLAPYYLSASQVLNRNEQEYAVLTTILTPEHKL